MNLKTRVPYKPGMSPRGTRAGNTWAGRPLLERRLLDHTANMRKQKSSSGCRQYFFIENRWRSREIDIWLVAPGSRGETSNFCSREGRAVKLLSGQYSRSLLHFTQPGPSLQTAAALSLGRCTAPLCHTLLRTPEPFSPNSSFLACCL